MTLPFRFDAVEHAYIDLDTGAEFPHITGMLEATGWIDTTWYKEEHSERGTAIHKLTADYDLGALDLLACVSRYRPYLLGHALAMSILKPEIVAVEEALVHSILRYGGCPDRVWKLGGVLSVPDIKSGGPEKSHEIQTALQAILVAEKYGNIPPEMIARFCLYLTPKGKFKFVEHKNRRNFDEARRIIRKCV